MSSPRGRRSRASSPDHAARASSATSSRSEPPPTNNPAGVLTPPMTDPTPTKSLPGSPRQTLIEVPQPIKGYQPLVQTRPPSSRSYSRPSPARWFSPRSRSTSPIDRRGVPDEPGTSASALQTIWGSDGLWRTFTHPCGWTYHGHKSAKFISSTRIKYTIPTKPLEPYQELYNDQHSASILVVDHASRTALHWSSSEHESRYRYWSYMERFPAHHHGLEETIEEHAGLTFSDCYAEALDCLQWCLLESTLSDSGTTVPLPPTVCHQLTAILKNLRDASSDSPLKIMAVARVLAKKYEFQAKYSFGTKDKDEFLAAIPDTKPSPLFDVAYVLQLILCFGVPLRYRYHILRMETKFLRGDQWRQHVETLLHEWGNLNLLATVFLAAGMAFLSASDVNTATRIAVIVSTLTASASLLTGLFFMSIFYLHVPDPNDFSPDTVKHVQDYIKSISNDRGGRISVFLSMPMVFLLWSVVAFTAASIIFSFSTASKPSEIYIPIVLGLSVCGMLGAAFVGWRMWQKKDVHVGIRQIIEYFGGHRKATDAEKESRPREE